MSEENVKRERTHSIVVNGQRHVWVVRSLWGLVGALTPFEYELASFKGFEQDMWYGNGSEPTLRSVIEHMQRIRDAEMSFPIILSETGVVMDGIHRLCKARLEGQQRVQAIQFVVDPPPDWIELGAG